MTENNSISRSSKCSRRGNDVNISHSAIIAALTCISMYICKVMASVILCVYDLFFFQDDGS